MIIKDNLGDITTWIVRGILMGVVTLSGWTINRLVTTLDNQGVNIEEVRKGVAQGSSDVRNIQTTLDVNRRARDSQFQDLKSSLQDHEGRIRILERPRFTPN